MHVISGGTLCCQNLGSFSVWVRGVSQKADILGHKDSSKLSSFRNSQCVLLGIPACRQPLDFSSKGLVHHLTAVTCLLFCYSGVNVITERFFFFFPHKGEQDSTAYLKPEAKTLV